MNRFLDANLRTFAGSISFDESELAFAAALQQTLPEIQMAAALAKFVEIMEPDRVLALTPLPCYDSGTFIMG
ncbi:hypothetical protein [Bilophila wadsworthia]|uniref:hypothetical protein n=1 Tax=Bilophila wadsworthia TaxID=35833 RepID=UPI00242B084C|nr:hypothetical protein [Bilophila wadsworthia]MDR4027283.1 hypothetical protein [Bilophila sp.]